MGEMNSSVEVSNADRCCKSRTISPAIEKVYAKPRPRINKGGKTKNKPTISIDITFPYNALNANHIIIEIKKFIVWLKYTAI